MSSGHPHLAELHDDQLVRDSSPFLDRLNAPAAIITVLSVLIVVSFKAYDLDFSLDVIGHSTVTYLWDFLVLIVPTPLLVCLDKWLNPGLGQESAPSTHAAKSEVMRRVMGLDRTGSVMGTAIQARGSTRSITSNVLGLRLNQQRPAGLGNRDNSCYQNSILQGLASLPSFPEYLSACVRALGSQRPTDEIAHTLRVLIADLNDASNNGRTLWTPSLLKSMSTWTQQDAQEYFSKILDDVDKSVARAVSSARRHPGFEYDGAKDDTSNSEHSDDSGYQSLSSSAELASKTTLRNPLEGLLAQRVACIQCGFSEGLSMIPFNCLTLSLGLHQHQHDLYERLDAYSKVEAIEGVECPKCTLLKAQRLLTKLIEKFRQNESSAELLQEPLRRLAAVDLALEEDDFSDKTITEQCKITTQGKVATTKTKQIVVARPPRSLAVHVNRSVFDPQTFDMIKNSAPVSFPQTLDLGPWCLGSAEVEDEELSDHFLSSKEQWLLDPKSSMVAGDLGPSRLAGPIYELTAAVTHYGRHENGHYICYRKYPDAEALRDGAGAEQACQSYNGSANDHHDEAGDDTVNDDGGGVDGADDGDSKPELTPACQERVSNQGWWRLSDHNVTQVDEDVIMSLGSSVFMLFYECVDSSMVLQREVVSMSDARELISRTSNSPEPLAKAEAVETESARLSCTRETAAVDADSAEVCASSSESDVSHLRISDTATETIDAPSTASSWSQDEDELHEPFEVPQ
ncbi:ubiquitin hydrolase [Moelleriella libera RCEF 2490]|uniref:ubiquitinyl hydrolase 1 n=1 Tax=Moelleriella libera RCEF 2490 TaxID=1081109 RepID=A0A168E452_9HYPO|nr:ubiquitin hydrolase [Moelleriella libera RCEF 2490]